MVRLALAVLVASAALAAQSRPNEDKPFPNTKSFGRATIQFQDNTVHMMALYDYSQRNHDGAWLLLQTGVSVKKRTTVNRGNFHMETPDGRTVPLPSQEMFLADSAQITKLRQNARIFERPVLIYFPKSADGESIRWFALPGEGTVRNPAIVPSEHGVVIGDLYFKSPTLRWDDGTYRLVFTNDKGHAELPIRLE